MNRIFTYIMKMAPYILISIPIIIIIRFIIYRLTNKNKINWYHEFFMLLFISFLIGLASQTIIPQSSIGINNNGFSGVNLIPFKFVTETYKEVMINGNLNYFIINFLGNIIMFIPLGFCFPLLWSISNKKVILYSFLTSLFIEFCQLFMLRGSDIDDLMLNTIGTIIGVFIYNLLIKSIPINFQKFRN